MKCVATILPFALAGCAANPANETGPVARCETTDCFYERDVRDFEVIDTETVVVYVGSQRCPFVVELDGFNCDVTFAPQIQFFQGSPGGLAQAGVPSAGRVCSATRSLYLYAGILDPGGVLTPDSEIDPVTGLPSGLGRRTPGGLLGGPVPVDPASEELCRVQEIRSINDDQLIELYVEEGIAAPPPPIGPGEIEIPEQLPPAGDAAAPTTGASDDGPADADSRVESDQ